MHAQAGINASVPPDEVVSLRGIWQLNETKAPVLPGPNISMVTFPPGVELIPLSLQVNVPFGAVPPIVPSTKNVAAPAASALMLSTSTFIEAAPKLTEDITVAKPTGPQPKVA
jgi:hypothetical protein